MTDHYEARRKRYPKPGTKAAKRLALRVAAVFENGYAPPGWVEIQRDDEVAAGGLWGLSVHDDDATELVCRAAGVPRSCGVVLQDGSRGYAIYPLGGRVPPPVRGTYIHAVPVAVALLAGLITEADALHAMEDWT